jgi:hypothetical protein
MQEDRHFPLALSLFNIDEKAKGLTKGIWIFWEIELVIKWDILVWFELAS